MITGVDLIREQVLVADGQELELKQDDIEIRGSVPKPNQCGRSDSRLYA